MAEITAFPSSNEAGIGLERETLLRKLKEVRLKIQQLDEEEPEDMESGAYQKWGEAHEELEDQVDELLECLDEWELRQS